MAREIELLKEALEFIKVPVKYVNHNTLEFGEVMIKVLNKGEDCVIWSVEDFKHQATIKLANKLKIETSEVTNELLAKHFKVEEFENSLNKMVNNHDASYGISWETVDCYVYELLKDENDE